MDEPILALRPLERGDFRKGYLDLLSQLTTVDKTMSESSLAKHFDELFPKSCGWFGFVKKKTLPSPYVVHHHQQTRHHRDSRLSMVL